MNTKIVTSIFIKLSSFGFLYLSQIFLARFLTVSEYGFYSYILSIVSITSIFASFGQPNLNIKLFAKTSKDKSIYDIDFIIISLKNLILGLIFLIIISLYLYYKNFEVEKLYPAII